MNYLNDIDSKNCVGVTCKSVNNGDFIITNYKSYKNVRVRFIHTGYETTTHFSCIRLGSVKDPYSPSVCEVGVVGVKYPMKINSKEVKEYSLWRSMLNRCYSCSKYPTYKLCEVSENFKSYEYFYEWCHSQIGFGNQDWQLDKDLLIKGNKVYSESTCVFLPTEINIALTKRGSRRGEYLIGVYQGKASNKFISQISIGLKSQKYLGSFNTEIEAFDAYKQAKENHLKELANKWKDKIDIRAYHALMNYNVNIDD